MIKNKFKIRNDSYISDYLDDDPIVDIPREILGHRIEGVDSRAFFGKQVQEVYIPNSINVIKGETFKNNQLINIHIPNSIRSIHERAFENNQLQRLIIPYSLTYIGEKAFANNQLEEIIIGENVATIGDHAFYGNSSTLKKIIILGNENRFNERWKKIGFPERLIPLSKTLQNNRNLLTGYSKLFLYEDIEVNGTQYKYFVKVSNFEFIGLSEGKLKTNIDRKKQKVTINLVRDEPYGYEWDNKSYEYLEIDKKIYEYLKNKSEGFLDFRDVNNIIHFLKDNNELDYIKEFIAFYKKNGLSYENYSLSPDEEYMKSFFCGDHGELYDYIEEKFKIEVKNTDTDLEKAMKILLKEFFKGFNFKSIINDIEKYNSDRFASKKELEFDMDALHGHPQEGLGFRSKTKESLKGYDKYFLVAWSDYTDWYDEMNFQLKFSHLNNKDLISVLKKSKFGVDFSSGSAGCEGLHIIHKGELLLDRNECWKST